MSEQNPRQAARFGLVVAVALVLGFAFAYPSNWSRGLMGPDEFWHADLARNVYEGNGYTTGKVFPMDALEVGSFPAPEAIKQSGYSLLVAAVWNVTGVGHRPMVAIALLAFALGIGFTYLLASAVLANEKAGLLVAAVAMTSPHMLHESTLPLPTSMAFCLLMATLVLLVRPTPARALLAGIVFAALINAKGYALPYAPLVVLFLIAADRRRYRKPGLFLGALALSMSAAALVLPEGSVTLFSSSSNYLLRGLEGWRYEDIGVLPYHDLYLTDRWAEAPTDLVATATRSLRLASRGKMVLETFGGPALGPLVFFAFGVSMALLLAELLRLPRLLPEPETRRPGVLGEDPKLTALFLAIPIVALPFFSLIQVKPIFFAHLYPLFLIVIAAAVLRLLPFVQLPEGRLRTALIGAALTYVVVYPGAYALWQAYRSPGEWVGRWYSVRFLDYERLVRTFESELPEGAVVVSDFPNEVSWLTRHPSLHFPIDEEQLRVIVERFDVPALLENPNQDRRWPYIEREFELVDSSNALLWLRRDRRGR